MNIFIDFIIEIRWKVNNNEKDLYIKVFFIYKMKMIKEVLLLVFLKFWNVEIFLFKKNFLKIWKMFNFFMDIIMIKLIKYGNYFCNRLESYY